jgi:hypothetical protein
VADVENMNHLSFALKWISFSVGSDDTEAQRGSPIYVMRQNAAVSDPFCTCVCVCVCVCMCNHNIQETWTSIDGLKQYRNGIWPNHKYFF